MNDRSRATGGARRYSFARLVAGLVFLARAWWLGWCFAWHWRLKERLDARGARHLQAMADLLERRVNLCARYRGRPGPTAPRSGSGVPLVPLPPQQVAGSPIAAAAVPGCGSVLTLSPEGRRPADIVTEGGSHPV